MLWIVRRSSWQWLFLLPERCFEQNTSFPCRVSLWWRSKGTESWWCWTRIPRRRRRSCWWRFVFDSRFWRALLANKGLGSSFWSRLTFLIFLLFRCRLFGTLSQDLFLGYGYKVSAFAMQVARSDSICLYLDGWVYKAIPASRIVCSRLISPTAYDRTILVVTFVWNAHRQQQYLTWRSSRRTHLYSTFRKRQLSLFHQHHPGRIAPKKSSSGSLDHSSFKHINWIGFLIRYFGDALQYNYFQATDSFQESPVGYAYYLYTGKVYSIQYIIAWYGFPIINRNDR